MDEYIKREEAIHIAFKSPFFSDSLMEEIEAIPAADVAPVRNGRWEYEGPTINTYGMVKCTVCSWWTIDPSVSTVYHYCPNCGAKMDG